MFTAMITAMFEVNEDVNDTTSDNYKVYIVNHIRNDDYNQWGVK